MSLFNPEEQYVTDDLIETCTPWKKKDSSWGCQWS